MRTSRSWVAYVPFIFLLMEIMGFIVVGKAVGVFVTLLLIIATTLLGSFLLRLEGIILLMSLRRTRDPQGQEPFDVLALVFSGFLLLIPGFITDFIGLLGLIPTVRRFFICGLLHVMSVKSDVGVTLEGEYTVKSNEGSPSTLKTPEK